jgi:hypothetical protein
MFGIPANNPQTNAPNNFIHGIWRLMGAGSAQAAPAPQLFSVPGGVYMVWVTLIGGAGGGGNGSAGPTGGSSSFGNLLTATGGAGGDDVAPTAGAGGTPNGAAGPTNAGNTSWTPLGHTNLSFSSVGYGISLGGTGGSGGWYFEEPVFVTPGMTILVTAGAGGAGGNSNGASGLCIVKW